MLSKQKGSDASSALIENLLKSMSGMPLSEWRTKTTSIHEEFFNEAPIAVDAIIRILYQECEGDIIGHYIIFSKVYNEQRKLYGITKQTVTETVYICKSRKND